ncbi:MAG: RluA family pseudouridine synthase [Polyangiaceae bacterium]|nr:RluA family pseudouridine synthase [Polyangiaceae bacterium]
MVNAGVECVVGPSQEGTRLDLVVLDALGGSVGRAYVRGLFESGAVALNGRAVSKSFRVREGDVVAVKVQNTEQAAVPELLALDVRLERTDLVVLNKPAGQPCAPIRAGETGTVANGLVARYPEMAGVGYGAREPGLLHRLDTGTSGLLLAARTQVAFDSLLLALRSGKLCKEYYLICAGDGLADTGDISIPIGDDSRHSRRVVACLRAEQIRRMAPRPATTGYRVVQRSGRWALVRAYASRAVRHQIRVHFAAIGHPLVGDGLYGGDEGLLGRQALHACRIGLSGVDGVESFDVVSDLPEDMASVLSAGD